MINLHSKTNKPIKAKNNALINFSLKLNSKYPGYPDAIFGSLSGLINKLKRPNSQADVSPRYSIGSINKTNAGLVLTTVFGIIPGCIFTLTGNTLPIISGNFRSEITPLVYISKSKISNPFPFQSFQQPHKNTRL